MDALQLLAFVPAALVMALTPGPSNLLAFANAATRGWGAAVAGAFGRLAAYALLIAGVAFGLGAVLLLVAHSGSGVIRGETLLFSAWLCVPAMIGMWLGGRVSDRIEQEVFRRATLAVLLLAGLNLIRRAYFA